jgi:hypothetical protein
MIRSVKKVVFTFVGLIKTTSTMRKSVVVVLIVLYLRFRCACVVEKLDPNEFERMQGFTFVLIICS